ncbi:MAG: CehA/McbA family metallohydrolase [Cyclobacteriaceae bacterium]|nr:CehA/McbA family metallohydrolase [Cyclobacteriaceae bacterium]
MIHFIGTRYAIAAVLISLTAHVAVAQFSNRYPKVDTYRHHIYLEAFEFPFYSNGPVSPVASPDGKAIAFSTYGWIWIYDKSQKKASRLTNSGEMDFLPTWSASGDQIAFVRDTGRETYLLIVDLNGKEVVKVDHPNSSELDPYFSPDGKYLYYSSSKEGTFDIWRYEIAASKSEQLTAVNDGMEMRPVPFGSEGSYFFISKSEGVADRIKLYNGQNKTTTVIDEGRILSQLWIDTNATGDQLALNWSNTLTWNLYLKAAKSGAPKLELFDDEYYVIYPSWNRANNSILFSMSGKSLDFAMYEISADGGTPQKLEVDNWDFGTDLNKVSVVVSEGNDKVNARVSIIAENGHPIIPKNVLPRFDSQNGEVYFYTDGQFTIDVPAQKIRIKASKGLFSSTESDWIDSKSQKQVALTLDKGWDKPGWYSGDHHFHLNYGGPYKLQPSDLKPIMKGEDLDFATPMVANLHFQLKDLEYINWYSEEFPKIMFGQEIRSHFHGHIGLYGNNQLYYPWFWGPILYETHTFDDRTNDEVLKYGRTKGEIGAYVHPISERNPLANETSMSRVPIGLVADVVNENLDALEVACLWSDEIGSSVMYHQFLNLGIPIALTAGTDAFPGYARCMAVGTTRIMVNTGDKNDWDSYLDAIRKNKTVVTNGPMIELTVQGRKPGEAIEQTMSKVSWEMEVYTKSKLEKIEVLVNGKVVWTARESQENGSKKFSGKITIPKGGWVAARVYGSGIKWPQMDSYPFAHTGPVWIGKVGSTDPAAQKESAQTLLKVLDLSWGRIKAAYGSNSVSNQEAYFQQAREKLVRMTSGK